MSSLWRGARYTAPAASETCRRIKVLTRWATSSARNRAARAGICADGTESSAAAGLAAGIGRRIKQKFPDQGMYQSRSSLIFPPTYLKLYLKGQELGAQCSTGAVVLV